MNRQQMFDKVKERLLDGKGRATNMYGVCSYETEDGLRCAAGILFPGEIPKEIKGTDLTIDTLTNNENFCQYVPEYIKENIDFVKKLQRLHDSKNYWDFTSAVSIGIFNENGIARLKEIATKYELEYGDE